MVPMEMVYGKHSVRAVFLRRPQDVKRVILGGKPEYHSDTIAAARRAGVEPELVAWPEFRRETGLTDDDKHQGVCVFTSRAARCTASTISIAPRTVGS